MPTIMQKILPAFTLSLLAMGVAQMAYAENYQPLIEPFTTAKNWTWHTVKSLPNAGSNTLAKDPNFKGRYSIANSLSSANNSSFTAYGTQSAPNTLVFSSGGWGTGDVDNLIKLADVVNPANLSKVKSNCNFGKITDNYQGKDEGGHRFSGSNYIDYQNIYKWTRTGSTPLYVVEQRGGGWVDTSVHNAGVSSTIIVTPSLAQLKTAIVQHGWHKSQAGKLVACSFG